jgi:hypothetical protein
MDAIRRREKTAFAQQVMAARIAQYDKKNFKAALKGLTDGQ